VSHLGADDGGLGPLLETSRACPERAKLEWHEPEDVPPRCAQSLGNWCAGRPRRGPNLVGSDRKARARTTPEPRPYGRPGSRCGSAGCRRQSRRLGSGRSLPERARAILRVQPHSGVPPRGRPLSLLAQSHVPRGAGHMDRLVDALGQPPGRGGSRSGRPRGAPRGRARRKGPSNPASAMPGVVTRAAFLAGSKTARQRSATP
jgi:hypothetical protein